MKEYPCLRFGASVPSQHVPQCTGIMEEVESEHPRKAKFVCEKCGRIGWWWSEKRDRDTD